MNDDRPTDVLGALPRTRPHRRSQKRPAPPPSVASDAGASAEAAPEPPAASRAEAAAPRAKRASAKPAKPRAGATAKPTPRASAKPPVAPRAARGPAPPAPAAPAAARAERSPEAPAPRRVPPAPAQSPGVLETAVQAAAELAEIGMSAGARALRGALSRLPRP
jgi:hypothetical protein